MESTATPKNLEQESWKVELDQEISKARNSVKTEKMDMSFGELISLYENKELIIDPEFQRLFRWDEMQKTKFIESLLLGIPIPAIFVAEVAETGQWEIVDGLQRLSTVLSFFGILRDIPSHQENCWKLGEGKFIKFFKDKSINELSVKYHINIRRAVCRVEIIKWDSHVDMRYELFDRLNSLGSPLSKQELRNCIFRPHSNQFNRLLKELAELLGTTELVSPTEDQVAQLYLEELVLRFFALYDAIDDTARKIDDAISSYMTTYMGRVSKEEHFDFESKKHIFTELINLLNPLGRQIFRGGKNGKGPFSSSLYDVITVGIASYIDHYKSMSEEALKNKLDEIRGNEDFKKCSSSQASSRARVAQRIEFAKNIFKPA
ncbi:MAG: DUF262 domain-containing protein [Thiotrichaceae bacterium]